MTVPTVNVTCTAFDQTGKPVAFARYVARLNQTEIYQGFIAAEQVEVLANAQGVAVLALFPNALGVTGSLYVLRAYNPDTGKRFLDTTISVPTVACNLHDILVQAPYPAVDAAQQAVIAVQAAYALVVGQAATATTQAVNAANSATAAYGNATAASIQAGIASTQTGISTIQATNSGASATAAASSATAAGNSASAASASAGNASGSASAASASAGTAGTQAGIATTQATNSAGSSTAAAGSAGIASTQAGVATTQATNASGSASAASGSAGTASTQATNASASAAAASGSAGVASTQATNASGSATAASISAGVASTQATNAGTSATNATGSATNAANSATAASGSATTAGTQASNSASSAVAASTQAGNAAGSASTATAQATTAAAQNALAAAQAAIATTQASTASAQSQLAQTAASSASSVLQQDLSAVSAALHRSPNAVTAMFLYDTSKDSDGGAWIERMQHTSWANEPLAGAWLPGGFATELAARGDNLQMYSEDLSNAVFRKNSATITNNTSLAPDGSMSADTLTGNGGVNVGFDIYPTDYGVVNSVQTFSIHVLGGTATEITLQLTAASNPSVRFNLVTGAVIGTPTVGVWSATALAGGGFRFAATAIKTNIYSYWTVLLNNGVATTSTAIVWGVKFNYTGVLPSTYSASPELVSNGGFDNGTAGWATSGLAANAAVSGGEMQVTPTAEYGRRLQVITTVVGKVYRISGSLRVANGGGTAFLGYTTDTVGGSAATTIQSNSTSTAVTGSFVFTATATSIAVVVGTNTAGGIGVVFAFDNISVKEVTTLATPYVPYSAQTNSYYQSSADGKYYKLGATYGALTEVFRGNKAKFPRLAMGVAEDGNVNIYDLTQPGRPMWMRFVSSGSTGVYATALTGVYALNGVIALAGNAGLGNIAFIRDSMFARGSSYIRKFNGNIAQRNSAYGHEFSSIGLIVNETVNAVAMTVLPDAPFDVVTGIQIPTIALATSGGVSVIKHDGTVANSNATNSFNSIDIGPEGIFGQRTSSSFYQYLGNPAFAASPFTFDLAGNSTPPEWQTNSGGKSYRLKRAALMRVSDGSSRIQILRSNETSFVKGIGGVISSVFNTGHLPGDIRRAYLCNTEVESVGTELVTNGTFDTDTAWTKTANVIIANGKATINAPALAEESLTQTYTGQVGVMYSVSATITMLATPSPSAQVNINIGGMGENLFISSPYSLIAGQTYQIRGFGTLTSASSFFVRIGQNLNYAMNYTIDNVSIQRAITDRSYKAANASIVGTLTKTPVAAAAQLVAFSGFGAANYISESWSADLDFGTGEFSVGTWVSYTAAVVTTIAERSAASGPSIKLATTTAGNLVATASDGTTTRTVTTSSTYNTGIFTKATANYTAAGKLSINVNGVEVASATGTPLLTMNNAAAVLTIGNSRTLDAPFPGSITLLKVGATVPTPEQEMWMYEQEKQMFRPGVQITLPDATPVLDLSYDELQDKWTAVQAGSESSFTGLVRTASAVVSAGTFTKVVVGSGVKALARTSTNPGVDIQIPAYGLREELIKRAEAAAKTGKTPPPFDFDAIAAQTDFVLPAGWKTVSVVSAGNTQREGATKNFIRLFDGFRETIRFAVAPGAGVWIRINAIKE